MTTPFAFAAVTAVLRSRITAYLAASGVSSTVGGVLVSALPPDRIATGQQEKNELNLFLHRVSYNSGWSNLGVPPRDAGGTRVAAPPLAVDLHYVVSAYGQDPLTAEILLGHALNVFHLEPVLPREVIRAALAPTPPDPTIPAAVAQSRLADQLEQLRISPESPGGEEVSRLWSAFGAPYRPSAFIQVSVVLVDDDRPFRAAFPVRETVVGASGLNVPEVHDVTAEGPPGTPITAAATLVVTGRHLAGPGTEVQLAGSVGTPTHAEQTRVEVPVGNFTPAVRAGLAGLVVVGSVPLGDPPVGHRVLTSEAVPVAIRPTLAVAAGGVTVTGTRTLAGVDVATGTIAAALTPRVGAAQQVVLLLHEHASPSDRQPHSAVLPAPPGNGVVPPAVDTATVTFAFGDVPRGTYVGRVRVDGVESPVTPGPDGRYTNPAVTI